MEFRELSIEGAYLIRMEPIADARGFFARVFCEEAFAERGLCGHFVQTNLTIPRGRAPSGDCITRQRLMGK